MTSKAEGDRDRTADRAAGVSAGPGDAQALAQLAQQARHDLARLNLPPANWVPARDGPDGRPVLDVLVVGAGMCGQTVAFALQREGVRALRVIDRAARADEGPWGTFARMPTLRSPKHLTGPDLGIPSLTYRAWHEARHGREGWEALYKVGRLDWRDYLLWVRDTVGLPVENDTALVALHPAGDLLRATLRGPAGDEVVHAREVVMALGREGSGMRRVPVFPSLDAASTAAAMRVFHSADEIDFSALRGRRVAVLGAGASACDNAATALEAGADTVQLFCRRPILPQVNKSKWTSFPGFFHGFASLPDEMRWRLYTYIFDEQVPPPHESLLRCDAHPNFSVRLGAPWLDLQADDAGVTLTTPAGTERVDVAIVATGFDVDLMARPEFAALRDDALLWRDRVDAARAAAHPEAARFPYLGAGFELMPREGSAQTEALRHVRIFNWGSTLSHGALAGDIPGLAIGAGRLARAVAAALFTADIDRHWQVLQAHDDRELEPTRWYVPTSERPAR